MYVGMYVCMYVRVYVCKGRRSCLSNEGVCRVTDLRIVTTVVR